MTTTANNRDGSESRGAPTSERAARASQAEDDFVALFAEVFGLEKTQLLAPEFPFLDIDGTPRYIDFALRGAQRKIAFEVDGPTHYQPPDFDRNKYEDDLRRQNSLIHQGWQVYRWTEYVAHRKNLVHQTGREFARLWADVDHGRIEGGRWQPDCHVVCASVQALANRLDEIAPDRFRYLIIDEAHHAAADSYRALLAHFKPAFTLGLTATPARPDGKPVLELYRDAAHRLSLKDAIDIEDGRDHASCRAGILSRRPTWQGSPTGGRSRSASLRSLRLTMSLLPRRRIQASSFARHRFWGTLSSNQQNTRCRFSRYFC
jgi:hypothetical protein